jgi:peroxiredoxin
MRIRSASPVLAFALVLASALIVILGRRLDALGHAYGQLQRLAANLHTGSVVPAFRSFTLSGDFATVGEAEGPDTRQVLFFFTTTCPYCRATLPIWAKLSDSLTHLPGHSIQVIGISLDSLEPTRRYATEQALAYPVVTFPTAKLRRLYRAGTVPETVVLDRDGRVLHARLGLLQQPAVLDSIYRAATLPLAKPNSVAGARSAPIPD